MCNHYEHLSADEIIALREHYKLLGMSWSEAMADYLSKSNRPRDVYPKQLAPVLIVDKGDLAFQPMAWGLPAWQPPPEPGQKQKRPSFVSNVRNTASGHWKRWLASAEVVSGAKKFRGGRCLVPATIFAEPDGRTSKPVIERWFARADGLPFFFAGVWREWEGDHGTIKEPNVGRHRLFGFLTTEPNNLVKPIHGKAMPVILMTAEDVERWLKGTAAEALELQRPLPDDALVVLPQKKAA